MAVERHLPATSSSCGRTTTTSCSISRETSSQSACQRGHNSPAMHRVRAFACYDGRQIAIAGGGVDLGWRRRASERASERGWRVDDSTSGSRTPPDKLPSPSPARRSAHCVSPIHSIHSIHSIHCIYVRPRSWQRDDGGGRGGDGCEIVEGRYLHRGSPVPPLEQAQRLAHDVINYFRDMTYRICNASPSRARRLVRSAPRRSDPTRWTNSHDSSLHRPSQIPSAGRREG